MYFLLIFYKINATNGHLHNHYFLSVPYLMKSSCWRKKTHRRVCEVIPGSNQFPPKAKLYSTYLVLLNFFTPTIFLKVSHPTSNAFDLYWKKKAKGRATPNRSYLGRQQWREIVNQSKSGKHVNSISPVKEADTSAITPLHAVMNNR